jgi:hypothetical protein
MFIFFIEIWISEDELLRNRMRGIFLLSWFNSMLLKTWCTFFFFFCYFTFSFTGEKIHTIYILAFSAQRGQNQKNEDGDNNKHIRKYLFKNFMIKVKEGDVICGACRLRHYKCRPCSDRQATCEHYVVSRLKKQKSQ